MTGVLPALPVLPHLPGLCAVCRGWGRGRLCASCVARFAAPAPRCARCALRVPGAATVCGRCAIGPDGPDHATAVADYAFPWDGLLLQFKHGDALDLARTFADHLAAAVARAPPPDLVLPVPLGPRALRARGFNQSWELARRLGRPACPRTLLRPRDGPHQRELPEARRAANVQGAFVVDPARRAALAGRHVAVVDDVSTTGATAREIATVLRDAGAACVSWWVIARTPLPGD